MADLKGMLVELISGTPCCGFFSKTAVEHIADHLIANGVTVQKEAKLYCKPVRPGVWNLTCSACDSHLGCKEDSKHCPECGAKFVKHIALTPELPEEVE